MVVHFFKLNFQNFNHKIPVDSYCMYTFLDKWSHVQKPNLMVSEVIIKMLLSYMPIHRGYRKTKSFSIVKLPRFD